MNGKRDFNGLMSGYFRARIRKDNSKLEVDIERMVEQNWSHQSDHLRATRHINLYNAISYNTTHV